MRVVGGSAKGRRLQAPPGTLVRPTSDMAREGIFNSLVSLGGVEGAHVLDLFAGTGAMGIEALSRGAASATFVERERAAMAALRANLDRLGFTGNVVMGDAAEYAARADPVDIAFVDPPYEFDGWDGLLAHLDAHLAVLESDRELPVGDGWEVLRVKRYGGTVVTLARSDTLDDTLGDRARA